ncbi:hypothetical protein LWI29_011843 [Acer saccharum]|uniref:MULE transposase domain-containing protein n=1 Tax=Acer saccharum TaxID=4024 RepID=A0AA39T9K7_ACESA|nr:hypothetical protein LWI29_011843 [Acer saccharum]
MMWVVREFVIEHTHNLSPPNHIQFLRSHRSVKDSEIAQLQSWQIVGVKTAQVMDHLVDQSGGYSNVGHTKKDLQNSLDSVRRTNVYRRPLVMLVGINHHHSTVIFGFGLLGDETMDTYTWLLQTFLVAKHGKKPKSVVTDGDKAMHKAIKTLMPESVRRLCC